MCVADDIVCVADDIVDCSAFVAAGRDMVNDKGVAYLNFGYFQIKTAYLTTH